MSLFILLFACADKVEDTAEQHHEAPAEVSWHRDVRPLIQEHCAGCHSEGQIAPFSFDDWDTVEVMASAIVGSVESGSMPPYAFDKDCRETETDMRLSEEGVATLRAWADGGYPQGDPSEYVEPVAEVQREYPAYDVEARPREAVEVDLTQSDYYRCMVTDTVFEEDTWLIGTNALIDNPEVVHHLIYYTVPVEQDAALQELDDRTDEPGIACYDGDSIYRVEGLGSFGGWAPGNQIWYEDPDSDKPVGAMLIPGGSRLVIEGHYNAAAASDTDAMSDSSGVGLWVLPAGETPDNVYTWGEVSDYNLNIPAGDSEHTEGNTTTVRKASTIVAVNPHMHQLGVSMETSLVHEDGSRECVSRVEPYDFNWQWYYWFDEEQALSVKPGDTLEMTCTFDNSAENQPVIDGVQQEPQDVHYGDRTTEEMCIHYVLYSDPYSESL